MNERIANPLAAMLAIASDEELIATRRLLHRAYLGSDRLGWPSVGWPGFFRPPLRDLGTPRLLTAACLEISNELVGRGSALPCLPCAATVGDSVVLVDTDGGTDAERSPVLSAGGSHVAI